ncbi:MAG: hypothetical protein CL424_13950 [Acidimicrobiaceae bacterium]|nr:hypothetical protein [Acidimicrobiaceae bacterium]
MIRRLLLLVVCVLALSACRLDVTVDVAIEPDGTGTVTMTAVADAELVEQVPDLVDDLRLDDAVENGWTVGEPTPTDDGGLELVLTHDVSSAEELANVLNSIGPPLTRMAAARTTDPETEQTTNAINGVMQLPDGFASFADTDLIATVGGVPFEEQIAASGLSPAEAMSFTYRVSLPGELVSAEEGTEVGDGAIEWQAPLDGSETNLYVQTVQIPAGGGTAWAGPLATISLVLLVVWVVLATAFIAFVAVARRKKARRREARLRKLDRDRVT